MRVGYVGYVVNNDAYIVGPVSSYLLRQRAYCTTESEG
jgi:hypothetical protein